MVKPTEGARRAAQETPIVIGSHRNETGKPTTQQSVLDRIAQSILNIVSTKHVASGKEKSVYRLSDQQVDKLKLPQNVPAKYADRARNFFRRFIGKAIIAALPGKEKAVQSEREKLTEMRESGVAPGLVNIGFEESTIDDVMFTQELATGDVQGRIDDSDYNLPTAFRMAIDMASSVANLHQNGWVHGDMKPDAFLVFKDDEGSMQVKITDFGKSHRLGKSGTAVAKGNPRYMLDQKMSMNADVAALAMSVVRVLEEPILAKHDLGDALLNSVLPGEERAKATESQRGIEYFNVVSPNGVGFNRGSIGKLGEIGTRIRAATRGPEKVAEHSKELVSYVNELIDHLQAEYLQQQKTPKEMEEYLKDANNLRAVLSAAVTRPLPQPPVTAAEIGKALNAFAQHKPADKPSVNIPGPEPIQGSEGVTMAD